MSYRNLTLRDAIRGAYMVRDFQIVARMSTVRFEVDAKLMSRYLGGGEALRAPDENQEGLRRHVHSHSRREDGDRELISTTRRMTSKPSL